MMLVMIQKDDALPFARLSSYPEGTSYSKLLTLVSLIAFHYLNSRTSQFLGLRCAMLKAQTKSPVMKAILEVFCYFGWRTSTTRQMIDDVAISILNQTRADND